MRVAKNLQLLDRSQGLEYLNPLRRTDSSADFHAILIEDQGRRGRADIQLPYQFEVLFGIDLDMFDIIQVSRYIGE